MINMMPEKQMLCWNIFCFRHTSRHGWIYEKDTQEKDDCHIAESRRHRLVIHEGIDQHRQAQHVDASCAPRQKSRSFTIHQLALDSLESKQLQSQRDDRNGKKLHDDLHQKYKITTEKQSAWR